MAVIGQRTAVAIIVLLATLMLGAIIFSLLGNQAAAVAGNSTAAKDFITGAQTTGWSALRMVEIGAIVLGAVFVLGLLGLLGGAHQEGAV